MGNFFLSSAPGGLVDVRAEVVMPTLWDKIPKDFYDIIYNKKEMSYNLGGESVFAEGCRTYAPLSAGDNYTIKNWMVHHE